jgi:hypothetical protein
LLIREDLAASTTFFSVKCFSSVRKQPPHPSVGREFESFQGGIMTRHDELDALPRWTLFLAVIVFFLGVAMIAGA